MYKIECETLGDLLRACAAMTRGVFTSQPTQSR